MSKGIGTSIGSLIGFIIGISIPSKAEIAASFLTRITGNMIIQDPEGFLISGFYTMFGVIIFGTIGTLIGNLFDI